MQLIEWPQFLKEALPLGGKPSAMTVGVFDGVHEGHQALIERVVAHNDGTVPVVVTFRQSYYKKNQGSGKEFPGDILSIRQKLDIFRSLGVSITVIIDFSESFRRMRGKDFLHILQENGKMSFLAVGSNFRCGYRLDTDAPGIQKLNDSRGIPTAIIQPLRYGDEPISSSQIRSAITRAELKAAATMMGRPFTVDLAGAPVSPVTKIPGGIAYDIASQGRLLPPPGRYRVFLLGKYNAPKTRKQVEILIEGGSIIIGGDLAAAKADWEYAEF